MIKKNKIYITVLDITLKGGIERFAANLSELLLESAYDICILSLHKTNNFLMYEIPDNVQIIYITNYKFNKLFYKITTFIACLKIKIYININNNKFIITSQIILFYLYFLRLNISKGIIASEHSTFDSSSFLVKKLRGFIYKKISTVITQTNDGVKSFNSLGIAAKKIPNPVTNFRDDMQWNFKNQNNTNEFIVLTVARLDPVKQLDHFIKIAALVNASDPFIKFKIVGSGLEYNKLINLTSNLNISDILEIAPATNLINHYYSKASLYLCTSKSEAFPMTILEALSYGIPVISYDNLIGPKEIIQNGSNGFLMPHKDFKGIAELIIRSKSNFSTINSMKFNCLNSAYKFSAESVKKKFLDII